MEELANLGTYVLGKMGNTTVVMGDVRDIESQLGKTVEVAADGATVKVKLTRQWTSAKNGGTYFKMYAETGELKRDGTPKRTWNGHRIGAAIVENANAEPMEFGDCMLYLSAASDVPTAATAKPAKPAKPAAATATPAAAVSERSVKLAELLAAGIDAATASAALDVMYGKIATAAPAASAKTPAAPRKPRKNAKTSAATADSVESLLSQV